MPDDEVRRQREVRAGLAQPAYQGAIRGCVVAAVHRGEHAVGAGLHRQVQERHQRRQASVRLDQFVVHVARVRGGVAQAGEAGDLGQRPQQPGQAPGAALRTTAVIGVHVLAQQRDLAHALPRHQASFRQHRGRRPAGLGAARIRHHAERAELVATFLHGEEGGDAARKLRTLGIGQEVELLLGGKIGLDHRPAGTRRARHHLGEPVVCLRAEHDVHIGCACQDLAPLRLRHAAGDCKDGSLSRIGARLLDHPQAPELREHLLGSAIADMAGVEDHHVRRVGALGRRVAERAEHIGHARTVIDVHLAAPRDDVEPLRQDGGSGDSGGGRQRGGGNHLGDGPAADGSIPLPAGAIRCDRMKVKGCPSGHAGEVVAGRSTHGGIRRQVMRWLFPGPGFGTIRQRKPRACQARNVRAARIAVPPWR